MVEVSKPSAATLVTSCDRNSRHPKFVKRNWREGCKISIKKKLNMKLAKLCTIVIGWFFPIFQPLQCPLFFPRDALRQVILSFARNVKKNGILTEYLLPRCSRLSWIVDSCRIASGIASLQTIAQTTQICGANTRRFSFVWKFSSLGKRNKRWRSGIWFSSPASQRYVAVSSIPKCLESSLFFPLSLSCPSYVSATSNSEKNTSSIDSIIHDP